MPVLPLIDLLIVVAWTSFIWAFVHKAAWMAFDSAFRVLGLGPTDFVIGGAVCLLFALALAARQWVKLNEPGLLRASGRRYPTEVLPDYPDPREESDSRAAVEAR